MSSSLIGAAVPFDAAGLFASLRPRLWRSWARTSSVVGLIAAMTACGGRSTPRPTSPVGHFETMRFENGLSKGPTHEIEIDVHADRTFRYTWRALDGSESDRTPRTIDGTWSAEGDSWRFHVLGESRGEHIVHYDRDSRVWTVPSLDLTTGRLTEFYMLLHMQSQ